MHDYQGPALSQEAIDAVLVGFINYACLPMDLALYASDLKDPAEKTEGETIEPSH